MPARIILGDCRLVIMPQPQRLPLEQQSKNRLPPRHEPCPTLTLGPKTAVRGKNRPKCRACPRLWIEIVALLDTGWKRMKQLEFDGIRYDICISRRGPLYRAAWVCASCCEQGAWAPVSSTAERASELAQIGLQSHHCLVHQASSRLK